MKFKTVLNKARESIEFLNRREQVRYDLDPPVHCTCRVYIGDKIEETEVSLVNVSEGGFFVAAGDKELPLGTRVEFSFDVPHRTEPIIIQGKIVRTHHPDKLERFHRAGVQFEYVNKEDLRLLFDFA